MKNSESLKKQCRSMNKEWKTAAFGEPGSDWEFEVSVALEMLGPSETLASAVFEKASAYSDTFSGWKQIKISFKDDVKNWFWGFWTNCGT